MTGLFLIAQVAGRTVAIASDVVASVVDIGEITPVPRVAPMVVGLAALRSHVVTVIDCRTALGLADRTSARRAVIVAADGHHYAMLVDALEDVLPLPLDPVDNGLSLDPAWREIALGVADRDGEPLLAIDLARLVPRVAAAA